MKTAWALAVTMIAITFAGCIATDDGDAPDTGDPAAAFSYEDDRFSIQGIDNSSKNWVPNVEEPPQLSLGQWWKYRLEDRLAGQSHEAYVVVAGQETDYWLIGMPTHDFSNDFMLFHIPGMGQVRKADLGFEAHDQWLSPVHFPAEVGDVWTTGFMQSDSNVQMEVTAIDDLNVTLAMSGGYTGTLIYDASIQAIKLMDILGYAKIEIIESGHDFHETVPELEGTITVPHMSDLILCHGRLALAVSIQGCGLGQPDAPTGSIDIDTTYDRVSFGLILGDIIGVSNIIGAPAPNTLYTITVTAPDGTEYEQTVTPLDQGLQVSAHKHDAPGGEWEYIAVAAGPGGAFIEGIGYHVYDVELPSGRILPSIGEHQHGDEGH